MSDTKQTPARARLEALLDEASFVELDRFVQARSTDYRPEGQTPPGDGVICGYGTIAGNLVYVFSQDGTVLGGSLGEMHARKIMHVYDLALKTGAPVIGFLDSTGMRLEEATDALEAFGQIYGMQTRASGVVPQILGIFGNAGGGMALLPALADFTFVEADAGRVFVQPANTLDHNRVELWDPSTPAFAAEEMGLADTYKDEQGILEDIRTLVSILPANHLVDLSDEETTDDLNRLCTGIEVLKEDSAALLADLSDEHFFFQIKEHFGTDLTMGFIRLNGMTVGAIANQDKRLSPKGCEKAARFVKFLDAFGIPLVSVTNVEGFSTHKEDQGRMAKDGAALAAALCGAQIPRIDLITGKASGSAYLLMNSKATGADLAFAWEDAVVEVMEPEWAVRILKAKELEEAPSPGAYLQEEVSLYREKQASALAAARRGYIDDVIAPESSRQRLIAALEMLFTKREAPPAKKHNAF